MGGSTARDQKIFNKSESSSPDYTEISSVPPLPLYALLAADEDAPHLGEFEAYRLLGICQVENKAVFSLVDLLKC